MEQTKNEEKKNEQKRSGVFLSGTFTERKDFKSRKGKDISVIGIQTSSFDINKVFINPDMKLNCKEGDHITIPVRISTYNNEIQYAYRNEF